ncbi:MAG: hypothetical protein HY910_16910 [Desulfarculus sp.]|nr:hypothetical protein [Desulfarculus sp.]
MDQGKEREFLERLAQAGEHASMWEIGQAMGLDRGATEALATSLLAQEALQMVSLSGKVCLTEAGRALCGGGMAGGDSLAGWLGDLRAAGGLGLSGQAHNDLLADLATLEAQLGRSQPLMPVVKACLAAIEAALAKSSGSQAASLAARAGALRG